MAAPVTPPSVGKGDRVPPHSEEAERGVLGSALLAAARVLDLAVERQLTPESFYHPAHQTLFESLVAMHNEGRPVDLLTVRDRLRDLGRLDAVGGSAYLEQLVDATPTAAHAEYYIDLVRQKHLLRAIIERAAEAIDHCYTSEEDASSILGQTEQAFFSITEFQHGRIPPWPELVKETMTELELIFQNKKGVTGIPTGFTDIDGILHGLQPGDMIVLAARPSMGKTSLALNIAENIALGVGGHPPRPVAVFSLEMSREQLVRRMLCCHARVSSQDISRGFISQVNHGLLTQAASTLNKAAIFLDDSAGMDVVELRARARRLARKHDIKLIVVDYLQLLHYPQAISRGDGRQQEVAAISGAIKAMAKELKVPVLILSQLSRAPEQRDKTSAVPRLSDLRDSGAIEQDADVVLLLRRPCYYDDDPQHDDKTLAIVDVAKHRNGATGDVNLNFTGEYTRFDNRARGVDQNGPPGGDAP